MERYLAEITEVPSEQVKPHQIIEPFAYHPWNPKENGIIGEGSRHGGAGVVGHTAGVKLRCISAGRFFVSLYCASDWELAANAATIPDL